MRTHVVPCSTNRRARQSGAILVIALVALVAMTLASVSLLRSIDVSQLLSGNIGFKRDAVNRATIALTAVAATLTETTLTPIADNHCLPATACNNTYNYVPRLLATDTRGIPMPLLATEATIDSFYKAGDINANAGGMRVRYMIERMCSDFGSPTRSKCLFPLANAAGPTNQDEESDTTQLGNPLFRVTIRVDGPRGTNAFAQAIVDINGDPPS